jgi:hypothetical protein
MKKYLTILSVFFLSSCATNKHYYQLTDGKWVSEKKFNRIVNKSIRHALKNTSKEDLELISNFTIDTITINKPDSVK